MHLFIQHKAVAKLDLNSTLGVSLKYYGLSVLASNSLQSLIHFHLEYVIPIHFNFFFNLGIDALQYYVVSAVERGESAISIHMLITTFVTSKRCRQKNQNGRPY